MGNPFLQNQIVHVKSLSVLWKGVLQRPYTNRAHIAGCISYIFYKMVLNYCLDLCIIIRAQKNFIRCVTQHNFSGP